MQIEKGKIFFLYDENEELTSMDESPYSSEDILFLYI